MTVTYFEVGWWKTLAGQHQYFVERNANGQADLIATGFLGNLCGDLQVGDFPRYVTEYNSGASQWIARIRCPGGPTWEVGNWTFSDGNGTPMAETFRWGEAGMSDHHHNLDYRTGSGTWVGWQDMKCQHDDANGWDGIQIANDHYETQSVSPDPTGC
jgi:hypothetical protein